MNLTWQLLRNDKNWEDLVLDPKTFSQIRDLESAIKIIDTSKKEKVSRKSKGYSALFYGPAGTGKSMTASLLGNRTGKDVYRVDLSKVISKFIGETEKNLANLFAKAESKDWILFFDEADALFGKRTNVRDAHDKYANQEISYLKQRLEKYNGIVIFSTSEIRTIEEPFLRLFRSIIRFPMPSEREPIKV